MLQLVDVPRDEGTEVMQRPVRAFDESAAVRAPQTAAVLMGGGDLTRPMRDDQLNPAVRLPLPQFDAGVAPVRHGAQPLLFRTAWISPRDGYLGERVFPMQAPLFSRERRSRP